MVRKTRFRLTVGAVSHRAFFVGSAKDARWDTAPTVRRTRFARLWRGPGPAPDWPDFTATLRGVEM